MDGFQVASPSSVGIQVQLECLPQLRVVNLPLDVFACALQPKVAEVAKFESSVDHGLRWDIQLGVLQPVDRRSVETHELVDELWE